MSLASIAGSACSIRRTSTSRAPSSWIRPTRLRTRRWRGSGATGELRRLDWPTPIGPCTTPRTRRRRQTHSARCCRRSATSTMRRRGTTRALTLDPQAWYALNNLCYAPIMTRELSIDTCKAAVAAAPERRRRATIWRWRTRPRATSSRRQKLVPPGRRHGGGALQLRDHADGQPRIRAGRRRVQEGARPRSRAHAGGDARQQATVAAAAQQTSVPAADGADKRP